MYHKLTLVLPKFLWKYVTKYLPLKAIYKIYLLNNRTDMFNDDDWKYFFENNRLDAIVTVRCNKLDNFWMHACGNYNAYDSIDSMFKLESEGTQVIYLKIFVKAGRHMVGKNYAYIFSNIPYIEINGSVSTDKTILIAANNKYTNLQLCNIQYISLKYISFDNVVLSIGELKDQCGKMYMSKCIFNGYINMSINCATIEGCTFYGIASRYRDDCNTDALYINSLNTTGLPITVNYTISNNTFSNINNCLHWQNLFGDNIICNIIMCNNIVNNSFVFLNCIGDATVLIKDNYITNVNICVQIMYKSRIIIENNDLVNTAPYENNGDNDISTDKNDQRENVIILLNNRLS